MPWLNREPDVVFGDARPRRLARGDVVELGDLHRALERTVLGEAMHQARERPAEALGLPHSRQRLVRVGGYRAAILALEEPRQRFGRVMHIAGGEVEALGPGRRDDVRGVAAQQQRAEPHWREDV